jgi:hypothetical protein
MKNKYLILTTVILSLFAASCAKSPSGVRTIKQTSGNTVNAAASNQSVQAAVVQNLYYEITSVSRPDQNIKVTLEVKTPAGLFLPITTDHSTSREAYGIYKDESNSVQLEFRARCSDDICSKYTLLMTVVKANMAYHQTAVVSYRNDCKFNIENINAAVTQNLYTSLNAVETKFENAGVGEAFDCPLDN